MKRSNETAKAKPSARLNKKTVLLSGASGKMGREIQNLLATSPLYRLGASVDSEELRAVDEDHAAVMKKSDDALAVLTEAVDAVIDFSTPAGTRSLLRALAKATDKVVLIGTTGLSSGDITKIKTCARRRGHQILLAGNTSLGVATLVRACLSFASTLAGAGFDIEISETHHNRKIDAPSGTALLLARALQASLTNYKIETRREGKRKEHTIGLHSVRGGGVVGEHEIRFISDFEEVRFSHRAFSRTLFAAGALRLLDEISKDIPRGSLLTFEEFVSKNIS